jgi:hypothetical protein
MRHDIVFHFHLPLKIVYLSKWLKTLEPKGSQLFIKRYPSTNLTLCRFLLTLDSVVLDLGQQTDRLFIFPVLMA